MAQVCHHSNESAHSNMSASSDQQPQEVPSVGGQQSGCDTFSLRMSLTRCLSEPTGKFQSSAATRPSGAQPTPRASARNWGLLFERESLWLWSQPDDGARTPRSPAYKPAKLRRPPTSARWGRARESELDASAWRATRLGLRPISGLARARRATCVRCAASL